jgi:predicted enzyme related to lactoylglutathione lyase
LADPDGAICAVLASSGGDPADFLASPGEWIWSSLLASDPNASAAFYQTLLGYDVYDLDTENGADHLILSTDDYARASVVALPVGSQRHPHWLNFIRVLSADDMVAKVATLGGRVLVKPHVDRHGGKLAVVADPAGAPFGLMEWTDSDTKVEPK